MMLEGLPNQRLFLLISQVVTTTIICEAQPQDVRPIVQANDPSAMY
jgi:hypothetical protein